jgi:hypothetical protein
MRRIGVSVLLGLATMVAWVPAANAEETLPAETTTSESPSSFDLPSELPTGSASDASTQSPTETPTGSPSGFPTELPSETPTATPTQTPTESPTGSPTESPTESPSTSPALPTQPPYTSPPMQGQTVLEQQAGQAAALATAVISPISMLTTVLFGSSYTPFATSTPTGGMPTQPTAAGEPSPTKSPATDDEIALSGSDTRNPVDDVPWGGLLIILLCGAAGVFGYSVASRGPGTPGHP